MNPANPAAPAAPTNPAPGTVVTPTAPPVADPSDPVPFEFGTPTAPPPEPTPAAPADEVPSWAKQFMGSIDERLNKFEGALQEEPAGDQPIGAPAPPAQSELAARNPQGWEDVDKYVSEKIQQGVQQGIEGFTNNLHQQNEQAQQAEAKVNQELDAAVDALQSEGLIPAIQNDNDRNDPGRVYRRELYGAAAKLGTTNLREVALLTLKPLHDQGKLYDPISDSVIDYNAPVPGANAPIGSSTTSTGFGPQVPTYEQIHKARSLSELRERSGV